MLVIPAIDLLGGKAVRLHQGRYDAVTVYDDDPVRRARGWRGKVPRLHVVDLEGARDGRPVQASVVREIVLAFGPGVQVGGGVRSRETVEAYLDLGADRVVVGTSAVRDEALVRRLALAHPHRLVIAVDARDGVVATHGWTEASNVTATELVRSLAGVDVAAFLYTDVSRDGTRTGSNVEMTFRLADSAHAGVIASGGVGSLADLTALAAHPNVEAVIVGRALYEETFTLEEAIAAAAPPSTAGPA